MNRQILSLLAALMLAAGAGQAGLIFDVGLNLPGLPASGTYSLVFALIDGSGTGDANNSVTLSNGLSLTLTDVLFYNEGSVTGIASPSSLSFRVTATGATDGGVSDSFSFWLVQESDMTVIPTMAPDGVSLLTFELEGSFAQIATYASDAGAYPFLTVEAPVVTDASGVPEPSAFALAALGLGVLAVARITASAKRASR